MVYVWKRHGFPAAASAAAGNSAGCAVRRSQYATSEVSDSQRQRWRCCRSRRELRQKKACSGGKQGKPKQCLLERTDEFLSKFYAARAEDTRFFGAEKANQNKATARLLEDLSAAQGSTNTEYDDDYKAKVAVRHKKVHAVGEIAKAINRTGVSSSVFVQCYDGVVHFLSLPPTVSDFGMPDWVFRSYFVAKLESLEGDLFWQYLSHDTMARHKFSESDYEGVQKDAIKARVIELTRENNAELVGRLSRFVSGEPYKKGYIFEKLVVSLDAISILVKFNDHTPESIQKAHATAVAEDDCAYALHTYPGGRKVLADALEFAKRTRHSFEVVRKAQLLIQGPSAKPW